MTYDQLCETLATHTGEKLAIELQQVPDPDAMASAKFVADVAYNQGLTPHITHAYPLSHRSNIVMARKLGIPLVSHDKTLPKNYDSFFYVDHSGGTSPWALSGKVKPDQLVGVIDHHDMGAVIDAPFVDKRPVGATATIISEYLANGAMDSLYSSEAEKSSIATGLLYGIKTDTANLTVNCCDVDTEAAKYLEDFVDQTLLSEIESPKWPKTWFDAYGRAIESRRTQEGITIADVGTIDGKDRDVTALVAESLLGEKSVDTAYVYSLHDDVVDISIRTSDDTFDYEGISDMFSPGRGGGREGAAGARIPLETGFVALNSDLEKSIREEFEKRIFGE